MTSSITRFLSPTRGLIAALLLAAAIPANATPVFQSFGPFPDATFGGSGIPNGNVAASTVIIDGDNTLRIALTATQRFSNPPLTNDGGGTFFATPGSNFGGQPQGVFTNDEGALWNFNFFIDVVGDNGATPELTDYQINVLYDLEPGEDTAFSDLGSIDITAGILAAEIAAGGVAPPTTLVEQSQNLLFGFLNTGVPGIVTPPASGAQFDPNAVGEYTFAITVASSSGLPLDSVAVDVQVVPEPTTALLAAMTGLAILTRRRR